MTIDHANTKHGKGAQHVDYETNTAVNRNRVENKSQHQTSNKLGTS